MTTTQISKDDAYCRVDGCFNIRKLSALCPAHDHQRRHGAEFYPPKGQKTEPWDYPICEYDGCVRAEEARGLCGGHSAQRKRGESLRPLRRWADGYVCASEGCPARAKFGNLCASHHMMSIGEAPTGQMERIPCGISWCNGTFSQRGRTGLCKNHALMARKYGLTPEDARIMYESYACSICGTSEGNLHVDHDHSCCPGGNANKCGKCVRGLLCMHCNHMIGNAKEDPALLLAAVDYLARVRVA